MQPALEHYVLALIQEQPCHLKQPLVPAMLVAALQARVKAEDAHYENQAMLGDLELAQDDHNHILDLSLQSPKLV
ncbi:unknown protein [Parachlamydia acanthamoebae UV-7]|jgi:hypothetical protein|uniref:Uncharacterized protein n=1 Tax=Parachlamydia acanthamoebae (strain UV7) TaxID=765952 RepID=F8L0X9_PARAV|nr:unknown protein [Parachlamydia acanthamoebae UV-7]